MSLEIEAQKFAHRKHGLGQLRKYTGLPYITHPAAVAGLVGLVTDHQPAIAAAWLHDVVEDTETTFDELIDVFGDETADFVYWLTDDLLPQAGNRAYRKAAYRKKLAGAPAFVKTIKLADLIDNTRSITSCDPDFAKVYLREKRELLEVLREGDATLYAVAYRQAHPGTTAAGLMLEPV